MSFDSDYDHSEDDIVTEADKTLDCLSDPEWPSTTLVVLKNELHNMTKPNTQDLLLCGRELYDSLKALELDPEAVRPKLALGREWRRLYTDAAVLHCLNLLTKNAVLGEGSSPHTICEKKVGKAHPVTSWERAVRLLDQAIVLAGAPGEGRLELALSCISYIQCRYLPLEISTSSLVGVPSCPVVSPLATLPVPTIHPAPSLSAFPGLAQRPFILPGFATTWPATVHWKSKAYLLSCAGRGRIVPIERGGDYRTDDWSVDLMPWDEFLESIKWGTSVEESDSQKLYLAQHSLFTQFPKLRADIVIPDYVYTEPGNHPSVSSNYTGPPGNEEQLVINAWCGGQGANSPAHTDPYYNIYVQVVGYKSVWLAPPKASPGMYSFNSSPLNDKNEPNRDPKRDGMLGNTSSIDVFAFSTRESSGGSNPAGETLYSAFYEHALPLAQSTTLGPGDALVIPPGWWHAMRGAGGGSFSVSFWF